MDPGWSGGGKITWNESWFFTYDRETEYAVEELKHSTTEKSENEQIEIPNHLRFLTFERSSVLTGHPKVRPSIDIVA